MKTLRVILVVLVCAAAVFETSCGGGGGGGITTPPPTLSSIAVTAAAPSVTIGQTDQMTATGNYSDGSTQILTSSVTWTLSNTDATISGTGLVTGKAAGTVAVTAAYGGIVGTMNLTVNPASTITSVTVACNPTSIQSGANSQCAATVAGTGSFNPAVTWKSSNTAAATVVSISEGTAEVTGLSMTSTASVTITATSSQDATKSGAASVTILRTITIGFAQPAQFPGNEVYSKYGYILGWTMTCSGCMVGDVLYALGTVGQENIVGTLTQPTTTIPMLINLDANFNVPGPIKFWFLGPDGVQSNVLWLLYRGSQNAAMQSAATGEIYYNYSGNGTRSPQGCFGSILLFKPDGTADGNIPCLGGYAAIAVDDVNHYLIVPWNGGVGFYDLNNLNIVGGSPIPVNSIALGSATTSSFAVATNGGVSCVTQPEAGTISCMKDSPASQKPQPPVITITGLNDPLAITMPDAGHVIAYCTGDQTLQRFTLDVIGGTATPSGKLALQGFTNTDANFWNNYVATGGWFIVQVGSTLGVMGQVVNSDGTVSQQLALVDNVSLAQIGGNYELPGGTILITPDAANGAIVAEYPDLTGDAPITRFARLYVGTGNMVDLASTSTLAPSVVFLTLQSGEILTGVEGQIALEPNQ